MSGQGSQLEPKRPSSHSEQVLSEALVHSTAPTQPGTAAHGVQRGP